MPGSVAEAQAKLGEMGVLVPGAGGEVLARGDGPHGEAALRLRSGGQLRAAWAVIDGEWLHYVDEEGGAHSTSAGNVADVQWDSS